MSRQQTDREKFASLILSGDLDDHLEQFSCLANGEAVPLAEHHLASVDMGGNVFDVRVMSNGRAFAVVRSGMRGTFLKEVNLTGKPLAGPRDRIHLLAEYKDRLIYLQHKGDVWSVKGHPVKKLPPMLFNPDDLLVANAFLCPMGKAGFAIVWRVGDRHQNTRLFVGRSDTGAVSQYQNVDKFVFLKDGGFVVFWHEDRMGKLTVVDGHWVVKTLDLGEDYRGDNAAMIDGRLWFGYRFCPHGDGRIGGDTDGFKVEWTDLNSGDREEVYRFKHSFQTLLFDGSNPIVWKVPSAFVPLGEQGRLIAPSFGNLPTVLDSAKPPVRFGPWWLFQTRYHNRGIDIIGLHDDQKDRWQQFGLRGHRIAAVNDRYLLTMSTGQKDESFCVYDRCCLPDNWPLAGRQLPAGVKRTQVQLVGDKVYGWSTVGHTLHLHCLPID
jgi:hypothetical protein